MIKKLLVVALMLVLQSCAQYKYAQQMKMVSFDNDVTEGKSVGPVKGEDCTWMVFGQWLGGNPTVDKAFINAMNQAGAAESAGFGKGERGQKLRYINNVATDNSGFMLGGFLGKSCLVVNGVGYL